MEFNTKEYNSVILGALFHDIGKVVQGGDIYKEHKEHREIGANFISDLFKDNKIKIEDTYIDKELVCELIKYHHDSAINQAKDELGKKLYLAQLVSNADSYSSRERGDIKKDESKWGNPRHNTLLVSIFSEIDKISKIGNFSGNWYYKIDKLHNTSSVIVPVNEKDLSSIKQDYNFVFEEFIKDLSKISFNNFFNYVYSLQGLMEEYFWAVPSITINQINDISLYDHLITTTAIAAALYKYHFEKNTLDNEKSIKDDSEKKFLIVSGDITGIQNFIFNINSINPRGLSKELRGRSFFISLLGSIISLKILKELDLPYTNKIIDAGGKFIILAPNTDSTIKKLNNVYDQIMKEVIEKLYNSIIPVLNYSLSFSADDFKKGNLPNLLKNIEIELAKEKTRKFSKSNFYFKNYKFEKMYDEHLENDLCKLCKTFPAQKGKDICKICDLGIDLGTELTKEDNLFINYFNGNDGLFGINYSFDDQIKADSLMTEQIRKFNDIKAKIRDVSNYIPRDIDDIVDKENEDKKNFNENSLCYYCADQCERLEDRKQFSRSILSFQCIATITPFNNSGKAVDHLAIIKGDVDNLGYLFSNGLGDSLTFSRYVYFSRMMNLFFTYYLKEYLKENFPYIYTIYAGGDDFLLLGPWEDIINALLGINEEFKKYVCENPDIHFSAAISLFRPKEPILEVVTKTEENLEECKENDFDKNNLYLFGEIIKLEKEKISKIKEIYQKLNDFVQNETLNTSNLYRLLNYNYFYKKFNEDKEKNINYLKYDYLMSYDIRRNFSEKKCDDPKYKETRDYLFILKNDENMKNLRIPLFWVIYKNRKTKKNKKED